MVVWLVMMSAVTQLNVNWQQKILAQEKTLGDASADFEKNRDEALLKTERARVTQDQTDLELRRKLVTISIAEARLSSTIEDMSRIKAQVADAVSNVETAKTNLATREAEKAKDQDDLAKKRDEIAKAQALNAELKAQLVQLQGDFKRILAENAAKLARATKERSARPASSVASPSPSS